jgi:hypothetical protein
MRASTNHRQAGGSPPESPFGTFTFIPNQHLPTISVSCAHVVPAILRIPYLSLPVCFEHPGRPRALFIPHSLVARARDESPSPYRSFPICVSGSESCIHGPVQVFSVRRRIHEITQDVWRKCISHNVTLKLLAHTFAHGFHCALRYTCSDAVTLC